jgi:hypothetical protein
LQDTTSAAVVFGRSIAIAVIAGFSCYGICYTVSACLVRSTIGAAAVSVAVVAVVTDFSFVCTDDAIAAAPDVDADILIGSAD